MPHPYVTSATIKKDNIIEIGVEADNYNPGDYIEVSGHATQTGGAFANFYDIQEVPAPTTKDNSRDGKPHSDVYVQAHPLPPNKFRKTEDVTIVVRVGKVWLTVLGRTYDPTQEGLAAGEGTTWDELRQWSEVGGESWKKDGSSPPPGGSSFPAGGSSSLAGGSSPPA
jgi:hypothetical protein